jgi:hypothetical protein
MQNNEEGNKWSFGSHQLTRHPEKKKRKLRAMDRVPGWDKKSFSFGVQVQATHKSQKE